MGTIVKKVKIVIGTKTYEGNKDEEYNFSNITLSQQLMRPNELSFTMQSKSFNLAFDEGDFSMHKEVMGEELSCQIDTAHYDNKNILIDENSIEFKGVIFKANVYTRSGTFSEHLIDVTAYSFDYLLMDHPHCFSYEDESLKKIVTETLKPLQLQIKNEINPRITETIPYTVQYNESNYDFLMRLAQRYGEWMYNDGKKLIFGKIVKKDLVKLEARNDVINYSFQADVVHHKVKHAHHNYLEYKNLMKSDSDFPDLTASGYHPLTDDAKKDSAKLFKKETFQHQQCSNPEGDGLKSGNPIDELEVSVKSLLFGEKTRQVVYSGSSVRSTLAIGSCIKICDVYVDGDKQSKVETETLMVTGISHSTETSGNYSNFFTAVPAKCEYPPYYDSGIFPASSAQRAKVIYNKDPEKMGRIRVQFLWQEEQDSNLMTPWIRIAQPHGGDEKGFYFIPELEEEVMVDFENGNAEKPFVVGTLWHGKQKPRNSIAKHDNNKIKSIRTRNGHTLNFIDEDGGGGEICMWDADKDATDYRTYFFLLSTDEKMIRMESRGNIELHAEGNIIMKAGGNIESYAGHDITEQAENDIRENANNDVASYAKNNNFQMASVDAYMKGASNVSIQADGGELQLIAASKIDTYSPQLVLEATASIEANAPVVEIN